MVVPAPNTTRTITKKTKAVGIPTVDMSLNKLNASEVIIKASEEYGVFKVINHGIENSIVTSLEEEGIRFFDKPAEEKQRASPASPFGYGCKNIGSRGDIGGVEYLLLHTNPVFVSESSKTISSDPSKFSCVVNDYVESVRELACEVLDLVAEGLGVHDKHVFSKFIRDADSDSCLRLNHYPTVKGVKEGDPPPKNLGFGEHSDPQILTILRSNDVPGLQICCHDGSWVPLPPDPTAFYVIIGDSLEALTNGRFISARHRVLTNSEKPRMSIMYFGAPPLNGLISPLPELVSNANQTAQYKPFTWAEYKKAAYSFPLGETRLDLFKISDGCDHKIL